MGKVRRTSGLGQGWIHVQAIEGTCPHSVFRSEVKQQIFTLLSFKTSAIY
jgi:hypothetical protein